MPHISDKLFKTDAINVSNNLQFSDVLNSYWLNMENCTLPLNRNQPYISVTDAS